jgi:hypothetical protein
MLEDESSAGTESAGPVSARGSADPVPLLVFLLGLLAFVLGIALGVIAGGLAGLLLGELLARSSSYGTEMIAIGLGGLLGVVGGAVVGGPLAVNVSRGLRAKITDSWYARRTPTG